MEKPLFNTNPSSSGFAQHPTAEELALITSDIDLRHPDDREPDLTEESIGPMFTKRAYELACIISEKPTKHD